MLIKIDNNYNFDNTGNESTGEGVTVFDHESVHQSAVKNPNYNPEMRFGMFLILFQWFARVFANLNFARIFLSIMRMIIVQISLFWLEIAPKI